VPHWNLTTSESAAVVTREKLNIETRENKKLKNPRDQKARLAFEIVKIYHGKNLAEKAEGEFKHIFKEKLTPSEIKEVKLNGNWRIVDLLMNLKMVKSRSEANRLIEQGGVKIDGKTEFEKFAQLELQDGMIIQVGKRKFAKIK